jgi:predicted Holliday junction resolvase-like endonuclease
VGKVRNGSVVGGDLMRDSDLQLLLLIAVVVVVVLIIQYRKLRSQISERAQEYYQLRLHINDRVQEEFDAWRSRELQSTRTTLWEAAQTEARVNLEAWRIKMEGDIRADAIRRSAAVVSGKVTEHLAPYMEAFPYNPKDIRFLGTPVDLIVFDGMNEDALRSIIFLEVKSGSSSLSTRERRVRDAVVEKRVAWQELCVGGE